MPHEFIWGTILVAQLAGLALAVAALRQAREGADAARRISAELASLKGVLDSNAGASLAQASEQLELLEANLDGVWRQLLKQVRPRLESVEQAREQFASALKAMGEELESRTGELRRFRDGYDSSVVRRLLSPFVRLHQDLQAESTDARTSDTQRQALAEVLELMRDALESAGVQMVQPRVGTDYRRSALASDAPSFVSTDDADLDWCIARALEPAWIYESAGVEIVLQRAKVEVSRC